MRVLPLRHQKRPARQRTSPLALVMGLGGSLDILRRMVEVEACPEALGCRLSGRKNVLHYALSEGAGINVVRYLVSRMPLLVAEWDSYTERCRSTSPQRTTRTRQTTSYVISYA